MYSSVSFESRPCNFSVRIWSSFWRIFLFSATRSMRVMFSSAFALAGNSKRNCFAGFRWKNLSAQSRAVLFWSHLYLLIHLHASVQSVSPLKAMSDCVRIWWRKFCEKIVNPSQNRFYFSDKLQIYNNCTCPRPGTYQAYFRTRLGYILRADDMRMKSGCVFRVNQQMFADLMDNSCSVKLLRACC